MKVLALRRPDSCVGCGEDLPVGSKAAWDAAGRTVRCLPCARQPAGQPTPVLAAPRTITTAVVHTLAPTEAPVVRAVSVAAVAGGSAQREYEKRSQRREQQIRSRHPRLGGLVLALSNEPASTRVWAQGARGERAVATKLDELAGEHLVALHEYRIDWVRGLDP